MDSRVLEPFIEGLKIVYKSFGIEDIEKGRYEKKSNLSSVRDVNVIIGLQQDLKGSVTYSMSYSTAQNIVSVMMGGMPVTEFDFVAKSGICEFVNMISAHAITLYSNLNMVIDNTPPTLIHGKSLFTMLSRIQTVMFELITPSGNIEINVGLENII